MPGVKTGKFDTVELKKGETRSLRIDVPIKMSDLYKDEIDLDVD